MAASLVVAVPLWSRFDVQAGKLDRGRLVQIVDSLVDFELMHGPTAGMSVAIWQRNELIFAKAYGFADLEHRIPSLVEGMYKVGSVTKQFTVTAILQLVERGKLSLNDELTKFFPDFPVGGRHITITELLNHTSGIKSFTELEPAVERDSFRLDLTPDRILALFRNRPFDFEPGTGWLYNNSAFFLLGRIIEKISGESYPEYLRHHIFEPLGMQGTSYCDNRAIVPHRVKGYRRTSTGFVNPDPESDRIAFSSGGLCSTVLDLIAFRRALASGRLISAASYRRMIEPTVLSNGWQTNYGFALARFRLGSMNVIRHGGTIGGFQANLLSVPEADLIVAVLANTLGADAEGVGEQVTRAILGLPLSVVRDDKVPERVAHDIAGRYRLGPFTLEVAGQNGAVFIRRSGTQDSSRLRWQGGNRFVAQSTESIGFYGFHPTLLWSAEGDRMTRFTFRSPLGDSLTALRIDPGR